MGTIYQRGEIYYVNVTYEGKRVRKKVGASKAVAELALKDLEVKIARRKFDLDVPDGLIEELFKAFLNYSENNHRPTTTLRYLNVIQNFRRFLTFNHPGLTRISQLKFDLFESYKKWRRTVDPRELDLSFDPEVKIAPNCFAGSARTINFELKTLRSVFRFGKKRRICHTNPTDDVKLLKVMDAREPRFLTGEECRLLLEHSDETYRPIFFTFLNTGLRLGELVNLEWGDIEFRRRILKIRRKAAWQPKSGERDVPLNDEMLELLEKIKPKKVDKSKPIFSREDGSKFGAKLRQALIRTAKKACIDDVTKIHSLRHTFASHLVMSGVDLPSIQRLLGHADIQTTMIYAHLAPDHLAGAVNKLKFL